MTDSVIIPQLIEHEGLRLKPYKCPTGRLTIGVGHNLSDNGITEEEAMCLLRNDIARCVKELQDILDGMFWVLPEIVQRVLVDMIFNLGATRFVKFKKMIAAIKAEDFHLAATEMKASLWYTQVGKRGKTLHGMMSLAV